ncbi:hypothetical protein AAC907_12150 [Elizabethkingia meningoseptica]
MSQCNYKIEKIFPFIILFFLCIFYLLVSIIANRMQVRIYGENTFFKFLNVANNIVSISIPLLAFIFFVITIKIMAVLLSIEPIDKINYITVVSYGFIPLTIFMAVYFFNLSKYETFFGGMDKIKDFKMMFGLTLYDFQLAGYFFWALIYLIMLFYLILEVKISAIKSLALVFVPTLVLVLFRFSFNLLMN